MPQAAAERLAEAAGWALGELSSSTQRLSLCTMSTSLLVQLQQDLELLAAAAAQAVLAAAEALDWAEEEATEEMEGTATAAAAAQAAMEAAIMAAEEVRFSAQQVESAIPILQTP